MIRLGVLVLVTFVLGMFSACNSCQTSSTTMPTQTDTTTDETIAETPTETIAETPSETTTPTPTPTETPTSTPTPESTPTPTLTPTPTDTPTPTPTPESTSTPTPLPTPTPTPAPPLAVTSPNGGEYWVTDLVAGATKTIIWTSNGITGLVRIDLSRDGGTTWKTIGYSPHDGNKAWMVTGPATTMAKIRVVSVNDSAVFDESDAVFTIALPSITIVSPNGGENWVIGTTQTITWTSNYFGYVNCLERVLLSTDGGTTWTTIIEYTPNDGNQAWKVTGPATTRAKIKVWEQDTPVFDVSDANFTIAPP